jgi:hypothetical protein
MMNGDFIDYNFASVGINAPLFVNPQWLDKWGRTVL